jgi:hypothetical protein
VSRRIAQDGKRGTTLAAAVMIAVGATVLPWAAAPARAIDVCATSYCATLQVVQMSGTGSGHITSDPAGIDCQEDQGNFSGTCFYTFSWPYVVGSIYVDLTISAGLHSYVCMGGCSGVDGSIGTSVALNPGDHATISPIFNLARKLTVNMSIYGTGAGRVTTSPGGIDCRYANGVRSGTCKGDFYSIPGTSVKFNITRDPDPGSYECSSQYGCAYPDQTTTGSVDIGGTTATAAIDSYFWPAKPVTISVTGSGTVTSSPTGLACPPTCSKWFPPSVMPDSPITLTAKPAAGWFVKDWTGACNAATGTICEFFNGYTGSTVGVVFGSLATPGPTSSARPPSTPAPPASARPPASPSSEATSAPSEPEPSPAIASDPLPSAAPGSSDVPGATTVPLASGTPAVDPAGGAGLDSSVLVIALIVILALGLGLLVWRRAARRDAPTSR